MLPIDVTYNNPEWLQGNAQMNIHEITPKKKQ